jgi:hypothetical protein
VVLSVLELDEDKRALLRAARFEAPALTRPRNERRFLGVPGTPRLVEVTVVVTVVLEVEAAATAAAAAASALRVSALLSCKIKSPLTLKTGLERT